MKVNIDVKNGKLIIDAYELFNLLSEEQQEMILQDSARRTIIFRELEEIITKRFSTPNFNSDIHEFRQKLLEVHSNEILANWMRAIIHEYENERQEHYRHQNAYYNLWHEIKHRFDWQSTKDLPQPEKFESAKFLQQEEILEWLESLREDKNDLG